MLMTYMEMPLYKIWWKSIPKFEGCFGHWIGQTQQTQWVLCRVMILPNTAVPNACTEIPQSARLVLTARLLRQFVVLWCGWKGTLRVLECERALVRWQWLVTGCKRCSSSVQICGWCPLCMTVHHMYWDTHRHKLVSCPKPGGRPHVAQLQCTWEHNTMQPYREIKFHYIRQGFR
jgi:hypothetical protein